jgi:hypothetical protein
VQKTTQQSANRPVEGLFRTTQRIVIVVLAGRGTVVRLPESLEAVAMCLP